MIFDQVIEINSKQKIPHRVTIRYILLQLPALFILLTILIWLYYFSVVSLSALFIIVAVWILKDFILFFYVWQAYDTTKKMPVVQTGIAIEHLDPDGYIQVDHELWRATVAKPQKYIAKGQRVSIIGQKGLTLIVRQEMNNKN